MSRKSKGRQKLEMVRIKKESNLLVTFSKRRFGVFKKASELSTLCGAEIAIIVFSPGKKVFSFGHPNVETVVHRYLSGNPPRLSGSQQLVEAHRNARVCELNEQLTQVEKALEMEVKRGKELDRIRKISQAQNWWELPVEELSLEQLQKLKEALHVLRQKIAKQVEQLFVQNTNNRVLLPFEANNFGEFNSHNFMPHFQNHRLGFGNGFL